MKISHLILILLWLSISIFSYWAENYWVDAIFATAIFVALIQSSNEKSSVNVMFISGFGTFLFFPAILNGYIYGVSFSMYYATSLVAFYFIIKTKDLIYCGQVGRTTYQAIIFLVYTLLLLVTSSIGNYSLYVLAPFVLFYIINLERGRILKNIFITSVFLSAYSYYLLYGWNGMGRVASLGPLLVAVLYICYIFKLPVSKYLFAIGPSLGSAALIGRKNLFADFDIYKFLDDSAFGPYRLASTFIENYLKNGPDLRGLVDQVVFSLLSFVPRDLWLSKPYGFGFQYTIENLDQYLIDAGHSIASTLIGDHIYYIGWWGILTGFMMIVVVVRLCHLFYYFRPLNGNGVILFSSNMMVFVWGGMTSLSARVIYPMLGILPLVLLYYLHKRIVTPAVTGGRL